MLAQDQPASSPAKPSAEMRDVHHRLGLVATRAIGYFRSMDSIEENLEAMGLELNPDLVSLRKRIEAALDATDEAIDKNDAKSANESLDRAEALVTRLAQKLGRLKMRFTLVLVLLGCAAAQPPIRILPIPLTPSGGPGIAGNSLWRRNLLGAIGQQPGNATVRDIEQIEQYMLSAAPYCTSLTPGDYEANRELARQMTAYLMTVNTMATDPQTRAAALRASRAVAVFPCAFPQDQPNPAPGAPAPPKQASEPPFPRKRRSWKASPPRTKKPPPTYGNATKPTRPKLQRPGTTPRPCARAWPPAACPSTRILPLQSAAFSFSSKKPPPRCAITNGMTRFQAFRLPRRQPKRSAKQSASKPAAAVAIR